MDKEVPVLFRVKSECCACGACLNICPKEAITMQKDEYGFLYPHINKTSCVNCGFCKKVCTFQNTEVTNKPLATYAAVARDMKLVEKSASGGVFASLARKVISSGGVAIGAELRSDFSVHHKAVHSTSEIFMLQGSKYAQSSTDKTFTETKKYLEDGISVLYSGTPCQVAGLQGYLGRDYDHLLTVDIICHGVPNSQMFQDYIQVLQDKYGGAVTEFTFRDKNFGWGINGSMEICGKKKKMWQSSSSYLYYFSKGWIYRENCYRCKYACSHRPADITIGDYWGIEKQHAEYLGKNGWDEQKGVSVVIANTKKGCGFLKNMDSVLEIKQSSFDRAAAANAQLNQPASPGKREDILEIYKNNGWSGLEKRFRKNMGWRYYSSQFKALIPANLKRIIKACR